MNPAQFLTHAVAYALVAISIPLATAAAVAPADWKFSLGWNGTVLPSSAIGIPLGPAVPPSGVAFTPPKPASGAAVQPHIGTPGGIFICIDTHWRGGCGYAVFPFECILLKSPYVASISSIGPDPGVSCWTYMSGDCNPDNARWQFQFPGDDTGGLGDPGTPWNDKITSFWCMPN